MASAPIIGGSGTIELPDEIFAEPFHEALVHEAVVADQAAKRRGTQSALTRGEVSMTTAKAFRQKGTGRARAGALSVPQRTGGGLAFAPKPRRYAKKVNRKARAKAMRAALSVHAARSSVAGVDAQAYEQPSTKTAAAALDDWTDRRPTLVVTGGDEDTVGRSFRNIDRVSVLNADQVGIDDLIGAGSLVLTQAALDGLAARCGPSGRRAGRREVSA